MREQLRTVIKLQQNGKSNCSGFKTNNNVHHKDPHSTQNTLSYLKPKKIFSKAALKNLNLNKVVQNFCKSNKNIKALNHLPHKNRNMKTKRPYNKRYNSLGKNALEMGSC